MAARGLTKISRLSVMLYNRRFQSEKKYTRVDVARDVFSDRFSSLQSIPRRAAQKTLTPREIFYDFFREAAEVGSRTNLEVLYGGTHTFIYIR